jgi:hypothetical protein
MMTSTNAFSISNAIQPLYIRRGPQFGTSPNIGANATKPPMFGTSVTANPNFGGNSKDTFERRTP